jgi:hypothetical protein
VIYTSFSRLYAQIPVKSGSELTITYTNLLRGAAERRMRLGEQWFFQCRCRRCQVCEKE